MKVVQSGTDAAKDKNAVTEEALKATGADSILLGGHREDTLAGTVVHQTAKRVDVLTDVHATELIVVGRQGVTVADDVKHHQRWGGQQSGPAVDREGRRRRFGGQQQSQHIRVA